jgi:hypothetical protein
MRVFRTLFVVLFGCLIFLAGLAVARQALVFLHLGDGTPRVHPEAIRRLFAESTALGDPGVFRSIPTKDTSPKLLVVGIDAMSFNWLEQAVREKRTPLFASLLAGGSFGPMHSIQPLYSPEIWTSFATGVTPEEHGIHDFVRSVDGPDGQPMMVANTWHERRYRAVWDLLSDAGITVGVSGWLMAWPTEAVNGFSVAFNPRPGDARPGDSVWFGARAYPENIGLLKELENAMPALRPEMVSSQALWNPIRHFVDDHAHDLRWLVEPVPAHQFGDYERIVFETARRGIERFRPQAVFLYWQHLDPVCHELYHKPREVLAYYEFLDRLLATFLEEVGRPEMLVIVSDHGSQAATSWREAFVSADNHMLWGNHDPLGVTILAGDHVGHASIDTDPLDLAPLSLSVFGLCPSSEMRAPSWATGAGIAPAACPGPLASSRAPADASAAETEPQPVDPAVLDRMKSLGYMR